MNLFENLPQELKQNIYEFDDTYKDEYNNVMCNLKTTKFIRANCDCEGCTEKHYFGCYEYKIDESGYELFNYRHKPTSNIITLNNS